MATITVYYSAVDGYRQTKVFKTVAGASKYATRRLGATPEMGSHYAVSGDGIGKIEATGCPLIDLFPALKPAASEAPMSEQEAYEAMALEMYGDGRVTVLAYGPDAGQRIYNSKADDAAHEAEAAAAARHPLRLPRCTCTDAQLTHVGCDCDDCCPF